jgi:ribulose 1,5-bisphosphate synthetase/thiazole synthase
LCPEELLDLAEVRARVEQLCGEHVAQRLGSDRREYDVTIIDASTAGCTVARLFALRGARVAIERRHRAVCRARQRE